MNRLKLTIRLYRFYRDVGYTPKLALKKAWEMAE